MGKQIDTSNGQTQGLGLPSEGFTLASLAPQGDASSAFKSEFTQAGPSPGQAISSDAKSKLIAVVSGAQGEDIDLRVARAGLPGREGLGMMYRLRSESDDDDWRGRMAANFVNAFVPVITSANTYDPHALATNGVSQVPISVFADSSASQAVSSRAFDFATKSWGLSDLVADGTYAMTAPNGLATVALPSGRVLAISEDAIGIQVFQTDDDGQNWEVRSWYATVISNTTTKLEAAFDGENIALFAFGATDFVQLASTDLGATFTEIVALPAGIATTTQFRAASLRDGRIGLLTMAHGALDGLTFQVLSSALQSFVLAPIVTLPSASLRFHDCTLAVDTDGTIYVVARESVASVIHSWVSKDGGATFEIMSDPMVDLDDGNDTYLTRMHSVFARGWMVTNCGFVAATGGINGSLTSMWSSGWSNFQPTTNSQDKIVDAPTILGSGVSSAQIMPSIELPASVGWTESGTTSISRTTGEYIFTLSGTNGYIERATATAPALPITFMLHHRIDAGTPAISSNENGFGARVAYSGSDYSVQIRIGAATTRVFDVNGASTLLDHTLDSTVDNDWLLSVQFDGKMLLLTRPSFTTKWTVVYDYSDTALTNGGATGSTTRLRMGSVQSTTVTSAWRWFGWSLSLSSLIQSVGIGTVRNDVGAFLSSTPSPTPDLGTVESLYTPDAISYLSARRGPGVVGEQFAVDAFYQYGIENIFPTIAPSQTKVYRTAAVTETIIAFDLGVQSRLGVEWQMVLALMNINFRTATLESSNDGTTWGNVHNFDASAPGFSALQYSLVGDWLFPATGTSEPPRPIYRNELEGGYVILPSNKLRRFKRVSPGVWTDPTGTTKICALQLEGIDGTEDATGACTLVWPSAVLNIRESSAFYPGSSAMFRYWRLVVPVQFIPEQTYYQIGTAFLGSVATFGKRTSRGWKQALRPNNTKTKSSYGVVRRRQRGPPTRVWSAGWADGVNQLFRQKSNVDWIRNGGSALTTVPPSAMHNDVWLLLMGIFEEILTGEIPVLALLSIPGDAGSDDVMICDRSLFLYGSFASSVQFNQTVGQEGVKEFGRIDVISVEEIP